MIIDPSRWINSVLAKYGGEECPVCRTWYRSRDDVREFHRRRHHRLVLV